MDREEERIQNWESLYQELRCINLWRNYKVAPGRFSATLTVVGREQQHTCKWLLWKIFQNKKIVPGGEGHRHGTQRTLGVGSLLLHVWFQLSWTPAGDGGRYLYSLSHLTGSWFQSFMLKSFQSLHNLKAKLLFLSINFLKYWAWALTFCLRC